MSGAGGLNGKAAPRRSKKVNTGKASIESFFNTAATAATPPVFIPAAMPATMVTAAAVTAATISPLRLFPTPSSSATSVPSYRVAPRAWSEDMHWREQDPAVYAEQHRLAMVFRRRTLQWSGSCYVPPSDCPSFEGTCEACALPPEVVVELMCGHALCRECMRRHIQKREGGRFCPSCKEKTVRSEATWIAGEPTVEERQERRSLWDKHQVAAVTRYYDHRVISIPLATSPPVALPLVASPPVVSPAPVASPPTSAPLPVASPPVNLAPPVDARSRSRSRSRSPASAHGAFAHLSDNDADDDEEGHRERAACDCTLHVTVQSVGRPTWSSFQAWEKVR